MAQNEIRKMFSENTNQGEVGVLTNLNIPFFLK